MPAKVIDQMVAEAGETGSVVDVAEFAAERRIERGPERLGAKSKHERRPRQVMGTVDARLR